MRGVTGRTGVALWDTGTQGRAELVSDLTELTLTIAPITDDGIRTDLRRIGTDPAHTLDRIGADIGILHTVTCGDTRRTGVAIRDALTQGQAEIESDLTELTLAV